MNPFRHLRNYKSHIQISSQNWDSAVYSHLITANVPPPILMTKNSFLALVEINFERRNYAVATGNRRTYRGLADYLADDF